MALRNFSETVKVLNLLKIAFPYFERDKTVEQLRDTWDLYTKLLDDLDPEVLKHAAMQLMTESKFFPMISELRERAYSITEQAQRSIGQSTPTAPEAWQQIARALHPSGYGFAWDAEPKAHLRQIVIKAAELFGEMRFALRQEEDAGTDFAQFRGIYETLQKREIENARMLPATRVLIKALADKLDMGKRLLRGGDKGPGGT